MSIFKWGTSTWGGPDTIGEEDMDCPDGAVCAWEYNGVLYRSKSVAGDAEMTDAFLAWRVANPTATIADAWKAGVSWIYAEV